MIPDVTVIIPVFNTMPYLTACLASLSAQTLGLDRMQVVAVDDGSTDGSGEELDRFAAAHPDVCTVIHQPNSGGPAGPCNRGLDAARGRYVFFLGADDYLGDEALLRLVARADEWGSDVVFGRMEGTGGRFVDQTMFTRTRETVSFLDSRLAFVVSNTKLFRRSLVERLGLRYALDLRVGSDQPFAIEAMATASKVSVLADYTYYYAVRRTDAGNITYASPWHARLAAVDAIMRRIAEVLPPGPQRDAVLRRHFVWELSKLIWRDFPTLDGVDRAHLLEGIGALVDAFLTVALDRSLWASVRLRLRLAQRGAAERLLEVIEYQRQGLQQCFLLEDGRVFVWFPGFREDRACPDEWYEATTESTWARLTSAVEIDRVVLDGSRLRLDGRLALLPGSEDEARVVLVETKAREEIAGPTSGPLDATAGAAVSLTGGTRGRPSALRAVVPLDPVLGSDAPEGRRWAVRLRIDLAGSTADLPVRTAIARQTSPARLGAKTFQVIARTDADDNLFVRRQRTSVPASSEHRPPSEE